MRHPLQDTTPGPYRPCTGLVRTYATDACSPRGSPYAAPLIGLNFKPAQTAATLTWFPSAPSVASIRAPASQSARFLRANSFSDAASLPLPVGGLLPSRTACNPNVALVLLQEQADPEFEAFVLVWSEDGGYDFISPGCRLRPTPTPGVFVPGSPQRFCLVPAGAGEPESGVLGKGARAPPKAKQQQRITWVSVFDVKRRSGGCLASAEDRRSLLRWFFGH